MTRFARAEGSKGSNKRECEDATPWKVMKKDILVQKENGKKTKNVNEKTKSVVPSPKGVNLKSPTNIEDVNFDETLQTEQKNTKKDGKKKKGTSLEEMKKNWVIEDGKRYKVFKDGTKKPWFDLGYEENDVMTRFNNFFIKHEDVDELNQYEKSLQEQNLSDKELRLELLRDEIKKNKKSKETETYDKPTKISNTKSKKTEKNDNPAKISNKKSGKNLVKKAKRKFQPKFEENEIMTNFEGYWILRENLPHLQKVADIKFWRIINNRTDGNEERKLTADEELVYRRLMKKEKRREMNLLQNYLKDKKNGIQSATHSEYRRQGIVKDHWQNNYNEDTVKFDGYYIKKEGAERLSELRETMLAKGCTEEEIAEVMKTERRKEERVLKRTTKSFCYQVSTTWSYGVLLSRK
ncbi:hypothetical protein Avbf_02108 [Armadillidium vulgare]|nr:hypothetical protein Avbf_02108 [Armadillidium vulgare]